MTPTFKLKRPQAQAAFQSAIDGERLTTVLVHVVGQGSESGESEHGNRGCPHTMQQVYLISVLTAAACAAAFHPCFSLQTCIQSCPSSDCGCCSYTPNVMPATGS